MGISAAVAIGAPSLLTSSEAMRNVNIGREEYIHLEPVFHKPADPTEETSRFPRSVGLAKFFDQLHLPDGSVIADTFTPCVPFMVLASHHPRQFVITNDRDFRPILADPVTFKARYLLVPEPTGMGLLDEINRTYPDLYQRGAGIATEAREFDGLGCPKFRLYAVNPAT
jgi:hypothetical protein